MKSKNAPLPNAEASVQSILEAVQPPRDDVVAKPVRLVLANDLVSARDEIERLFSAALALSLKEATTGSGVADLERSVAARLVPIAQRFLALLFATACCSAMREDIEARGLKPGEFRVRSDEDGYATIHTTFGRITFPVFAYSDLTTPAPVIRHPAQKVLPYHRSCRSSPMCLEWEVRLGHQHPFRKAEEMFHFFSRGASTIEDTTIGRHILYLSHMVDASWLYRTPDDMRRVVAERATRDRKTGRPIIYFSTDAHALRRYVGITWAKHWKMVNGIRVWCEDAETGNIIHLGGEFLWGDCEVIEARIRELLATGLLPGPNADEAWRAVNAQLVFISDGAEWFVDRILPLVPDAIGILDLYHLIDWFSEFGKAVFAVGSDAARDFHAKLRRILLRKRPKPTDTEPRTRKGNKKVRRRHRSHAHEQPWEGQGRPRTALSDATAEALIDFLIKLDLPDTEHMDAWEKLLTKVVKNASRIDYPALLARGFQIGSGAMESMHRTGSQLRLKLPGATWLEETSQAVLVFRMLDASGRWDEFWRQKDLALQIAGAFHEVRNRPTLAAS